MSMADMIDERLVSFGLDVTNKEDAIRKICKMMYDAGKYQAMKTTYRELKTENLNLRPAWEMELQSHIVKGAV